MRRRQFISPSERERRITVLMKRNDWTWYRLAKEMGMGRTSALRSLSPSSSVYAGCDPSLDTLKRLARAFGTSAGFFIDQEVKR